MRCEAVMKTDVHTVKLEDSAAIAAAKMRSCDCGFLPVTDDYAHVLGVVTDRDLVLRVMAMGKGSSTCIKDVMSRDVIGCHSGDDLAQAEKLMSGYKKSRIVCMDDNGRLIGVISLSDIAQVDDERRAGKTIRKITEREAHVV
jgi:CBS-domain-containing membrane protein